MSAGIKTVIPSNPYDAKGLLIAAIEDNDPVIFFEPKRIYNGPFSGYYDRPVEPWSKHAGSDVPKDYYRIELGKAADRSRGRGADRIDLWHDGPCLRSGCYAKPGIDAEMIDLRTLLPLDIETIEASVKKTGRCMVVHEATRTSGFGAELAALVQERCFYHLEAPVERVTGFDTPYPHSLEWAYFPGPVRMATRYGKADCRSRTMGKFTFKLPDIGEGIAEAEIVAWHVKVGDRIEEDQPIADMMTDKATVEMESPVSGIVTAVAGEAGDVVSIGAMLVEIETEGAGNEVDEAPKPVEQAKTPVEAATDAI